MAAPEQVGIAQEVELQRLAELIKQALGEEVGQLPDYPTYYFDPTLLHVEQLRWVNQALTMIVDPESLHEGQEQGEESTDDSGEPDVTSEESESTETDGEAPEDTDEDAPAESQDEPGETEPAKPGEVPAKATPKRRN